MAGSGSDRGDGIAYLLVQLGFHMARKFSERLAPLGLEPRQVGMLTRLAANEGRSQQAIGELMGLNPTRMVFLVDELEKQGLVERRRNPADRRSPALYLTDHGRETLPEAQQAGPRGAPDGRGSGSRRGRPARPARKGRGPRG